MGGHRAASGTIDRSPEARGDQRIREPEERDEPEVLSVASTGTSLDVLGFSALLGALSAILAVTTLAYRWPAFAEPVLALATGLGVWMAVCWWLAQRAFGLGAVLRRSSGLGAWQWLALLLLHEPVASAGVGGELNQAGGWLDEVLPAISGDFAQSMLWTCAAVYALLWSLRRSRHEPRALA